jgi:hypothetical protein
MRQSCADTLVTEEPDEPDERMAHVRICGGCALQAHGRLWPEMVALTKPSQQSSTESCVVCGNHHEA